MSTATGTAPFPAAKKKHAPHFRGLPLVGSLMEVRSDPLATFAKASKLGDVVHLTFPGRVGHLLTHPEHVKRVLVDNHRSYGKQTRGYKMLRIVLGQGLVTSEGDFWKRQRRIAQPAFHHHRISAFAHIMTSVTEGMLERWDVHAKSGGPIDVDAEMMSSTLRIVGLCLLGADLSDESDAVGHAVATMLGQTVQRIQRLNLPLFIPTPANVSFSRALRVMDELVLGLIAERRRGGEAKDLLQMFMEVEDEETGEKMDDRQLRDEVMTMVLAGHETTSNALTWTFYLLSRSPEAQARLQAELREVLNGRTPSMEDLPRLRYTDAVVKEAMRLFPPVWMIARSVAEADEIGGYEIPKGSMVFLSQWVTHRDARFWKNPGGFEPERFLAEDFDSIPKYAYFPFAGGPRVCIGNGFAAMEARLMLATIAQRYRLDLVEGHAVRPKPTVTLRPRYGMKMTVSRV